MAKSRNAPRVAGVTVYRRRGKWVYLVDLAPDPVTGQRRRQYQGGFDTHEAALTAAIEAKQSLSGGHHVPPSRRTASDFFAEWLDTVEQELKPSSNVNYCDYVSAYVVPRIGKRRLQDIDVPTLNALYRRLLTAGRRKPDTNTTMYEFWQTQRHANRAPTPAEVSKACGTSIHAARAALTRYRRGRVPHPLGTGLAPKTVRNVHRMIHRAFRDAVAWRYLAYNPAEHASLPRTRRDHGRPTPWTSDQLLQWLKVALQDRDAAMWVLAATTGMRRSELAGKDPEQRRLSNTRTSRPAGLP